MQSQDTSLGFVTDVSMMCDLATQVHIGQQGLLLQPVALWSTGPTCREASARLSKKLVDIYSGLFGRKLGCSLTLGWRLLTCQPESVHMTTSSSKLGTCGRYVKHLLFVLPPEFFVRNPCPTWKARAACAPTSRPTAGLLLLQHAHILGSLPWQAFERRKTAPKAKPKWGPSSSGSCCFGL